MICHCQQKIRKLLELAIERNGTIEETIHVVTVVGSFENCYITRNTFFYLLE